MRAELGVFDFGLRFVVLCSHPGIHTLSEIVNHYISRYNIDVVHVARFTDMT